MLSSMSNTRLDFILCSSQVTWAWCIIRWQTSFFQKHLNWCSWGQCLDWVNLGRLEVPTYNIHPVHAQQYHQDIFDGEENQHLVKDPVVDYDGDPDDKERAILGKSRLHDAKYVRSMFFTHSHWLDLNVVCILFVSASHF